MWLVLMILSGAAWYDVQEKRVPNWWNLGAALCGLGLCVLNTADGGGGLEILLAVLAYLARLTVVTMVLFPLFLMRVMGAGDIKIMAVLVGCLGPFSSLCVIAYGFIIGAILALVKMLAQRSLRKRLMILAAYIRRLLLTKELMPYYQAERDRRDGTIPFVVCLLVGFLWYMVSVLVN